MKKQSIGLTVLLWCEIIVSARVLLFTIPVLINKHKMANGVFSVNDWFIIVVSMAALLYFIVGVASLGGHRFWKFFHYLATALIAILTIGIFKLVASSGASQQSFVFYVPFVVSVIVTFLIGMSNSFAAFE